MLPFPEMTPAQEAEFNAAFDEFTYRQASSPATLAAEDAAKAKAEAEFNAAFDEWVHTRPCG